MDTNLRYDVSLPLQFLIDLSDDKIKLHTIKWYDGKLKVRSNVFYELFIVWCKEKGIVFNNGITNFGKQITKIIGHNKIKTNGYMLYTIDKAELVSITNEIKKSALILKNNIANTEELYQENYTAKFDLPNCGPIEMVIDEPITSIIEIITDGDFGLANIFTKFIKNFVKVTNLISGKGVMFNNISGNWQPVQKDHIMILIPHVIKTILNICVIHIKKVSNCQQTLKKLAEIDKKITKEKNIKSVYNLAKVQIYEQPCVNKPESLNINYKTLNPPINVKAKELHVVDKILTHFPQYEWIKDKTIVGGNSKRRPDLLLQLEDKYIIVEIDECEHKSYKDEQEAARIKEIVMDLHSLKIMPVIVIRFNPDKYVTNDGNKIESCWSYIDGRNCITNYSEWKHRIGFLREQIKYHIENSNYGESDIIVVKLFFSEK